MGNMLTGARPIHEVDVSRALHGRFLRIPPFSPLPYTRLITSNAESYFYRRNFIILFTFSRYFFG